MIRRFSSGTCFFPVLFLLSHACAVSGEEWLTSLDSTLCSHFSSSSAAKVARTAGAYRKAAEPVGRTPFDWCYAVGLLDRGAFCDAAFELLDEAMRRERILEEGWRSIRSVSDAAISPDHFVRRGAESDYNFLKCRLRLLIGLARAGIAQRMASPSTGAYALQAMESAIDALRDAAAFGERASTHSRSLGNANPDPARIKALRDRLLAVCDLSQKRADTGPIAAIDLRKLVKEALYLR